MSIALIGLNHKTASLAMREDVAISAEQMPSALKALQGHTDQAVIISTCNRTEIIAADICPQGLTSWLASYSNQTLTSISNHSYAYQDEHAIGHMIKVASGMDSMVLGEPQIMGQIKDAIACARQADMVGPKLDRALRFIVAGAKDIRHQTAIGHCPVSVALSAVELAKTQARDLTRSQILVIGAGQTAALLCKHLQSFNANNINIINRSYHKACQLAQEHGLAPHHWQQLTDLIARCDLIISATGAPQVIIDHKMIAAQKTTSSKIIIDLAMPRDIASEVADFEHIQLKHLDDINTIINKNTLNRSQAAMAAGPIVDSWVEQYIAEIKSRHADQTITKLRYHIQELRDQELQRSLQRLEAGADPEQVLQQFAHSLTNKWLHQPSTQLKSACIQGKSELIELTQKLFAIGQ